MERTNDRKTESEVVEYPHEGRYPDVFVGYWISLRPPRPVHCISISLFDAGECGEEGSVTRRPSRTDDLETSGMRMV